jgi:hypothetical protein
MAHTNGTGGDAVMQAILTEDPRHLSLSAMTPKCSKPF